MAKENVYNPEQNTDTNILIIQSFAHAKAHLNWITAASTQPENFEAQTKLHNLVWELDQQ